MLVTVVVFVTVAVGPIVVDVTVVVVAVVGVTVVGATVGTVVVELRVVVDGEIRAPKKVVTEKKDGK